MPGDAGDDGGIEDKLVYIDPGARHAARAGRHRLRRHPLAGEQTAQPTAEPAAAADSSRVDLDMERYDL